MDEGSWLREAEQHKGKEREWELSHPFTKKATLDKPFLRVIVKTY